MAGRVAASLGSSKDVITNYYGNFILTGADRKKWDKRATASHKKRVKAK